MTQRTTKHTSNQYTRRNSHPRQQPASNITKSRYDLFTLIVRQSENEQIGQSKCKFLSGALHGGQGMDKMLCHLAGTPVLELLFGRYLIGSKSWVLMIATVGFQYGGAFCMESSKQGLV
jgi:hypothetical protein